MRSPPKMANLYETPSVRLAKLTRLYHIWQMNYIAYVVREEYDNALATLENIIRAREEAADICYGLRGGEWMDPGHYRFYQVVCYEADCLSDYLNKHYHDGKRCDHHCRPFRACSEELVRDYERKYGLIPSRYVPRSLLSKYH